MALVTLVSLGFSLSAVYFAPARLDGNVCFSACMCGFVHAKIADGQLILLEQHHDTPAGTAVATIEVKDGMCSFSRIGVDASSGPAARLYVDHLGAKYYDETDGFRPYYVLLDDNWKLYPGLLEIQLRRILKFDWQILDLADLAVFLLLTVLPYATALHSIISRTGATKTRVERAVLAAGVLLTIHLAAIVVLVEKLLRAPLAFDPHPYDGLIQNTLNLTLPSIVVGIVAGLLFRNRLGCNRTFIVGVVLFIGAALGFVWYGNHFFGLMGEPLADHVWWAW